MAKKVTKTYGVYGLMDWQPILHVGKARFQPLFEGGGATAYGETPAKYTTSNPIFQHIIESSHYYQCGHIQLLYSNEEVEKNDEETNALESEAEDVKAHIAQEEGDIAADGMTVMEFASTGDASQYLAETFDIPKSQLRGRTNVIAIAKEHGIAVKFTE